MFREGLHYNRRQFLKLLAVATTTAVLPSSCLDPNQESPKICDTLNSWHGVWAAWGKNITDPRFGIEISQDSRFFDYSIIIPTIKIIGFSSGPKYFFGKSAIEKELWRCPYLNEHDPLSELAEMQANHEIPSGNISVHYPVTPTGRCLNIGCFSIGHSIPFTVPENTNQLLETYVTSTTGTIIEATGRSFYTYFATDVQSPLLAPVLFAEKLYYEYLKKKGYGSKTNIPQKLSMVTKIATIEQLADLEQITVWPVKFNRNGVEIRPDDPLPLYHA